MKLRHIIKNSLTGLLVVSMFGLASVFSAGKVQAIPYGDPAPVTPAFNIYTGAPHGVGDEPDFVRLRNSNGNPTVSAVENNFVDPLGATCNVGDMFDVRTYVHNGATEHENDNGNGSAVAHDVVVNMNAPLGENSDSFTFESTVSASNAASVTDTGTLNCENDVQLELVPQTVNVYSRHYGWQSQPDSAVNGSLTIGSRAVASGDVWGCWEDRVIVVYTVRVVEQPQSIALCEVLDMTVIGDRRVEATITGETTNATLIGYRIEWGDGSETTSQTAEHEYAEYGTYKLTGFVNARYHDGTTEWLTGDACMQQITFTEDEQPEVLPQTGVGSLAAIFAGTTVGGAIAHRLRSLRRLGK